MAEMAMSRELVEQYIENEKQIRDIRNRCDNLRKEAHTEVQRLKWDVYEQKIRALQDERDEKIRYLHKKKDEKIAEADKQIEGLHTTIARVDRIVMFLRVGIKDLTIADTDVKAYRDKHCESLGYIIDDDLLKIKLFIVENDKPKNKYSLVAVGKCAFNKDLCGLPYSYALPSHEEGWFSLKACIVDRPSIHELKMYLQKWRTTILSRLSGKYAETKSEYCKVLQTYKLEDFEALMKYRCGSCSFFYTAKEISKRSMHESVKCPKCGEIMHESEV